MEDKKEQVKGLSKLLIIVAIIVILFVILFIRFLVSFVHSNVEYDGYCRLNYGEEWIYENEKIFGNSCVKPNYENHSIERLYFSKEEKNNFCTLVRFWDLKSWIPKCQRSVK